MGYRSRNIHNNYQCVFTWCKSELVLHRWLIERRIHMACLYFDLALFTNRTIGMTSFSIGTNRTIGTNGPSELPCTQPDHMGNLSPLNKMHIHQQNHWNDVLFYWYQSYHWYQWTIGSALYPARSRGKIIQNHWNDIIFYWYQSYHWYQWTIGLTNRIRLCILDMCFRNGFCVFWGKSKTDHEPIKSTPSEDFSDQIQIWIFDIHNLSGFLGKDLKKVFFTSGFPNKNGAQQMLYDILTEPMLVRRLNFEPLGTFHSMFVIYIHSQTASKPLRVMFFVRMQCLFTPVYFASNNKKNSSASVLNFYNFTILSVYYQRNVCVSNRNIYILYIYTYVVYVEFLSCLRGEDQFVVFSSIFLITRSTRTSHSHGK